MAGNAIFFAEYIMWAAGTPLIHKDTPAEDVAPYNAKVRGIALGAVTFACIIHSIWRRGGIWLNNIFAIVKILILVLIIIVGILAGAGVFGQEANNATANMSVKNSFADSASDSYGYCEAFLTVIFAYGGFEQANYVCVFSARTNDGRFLADTYPGPR